MKPLHLWGMLLFTLCLTHLSYAKKPSLTLELTCEQKIAMILPYVDDFKTYPKETINEMIEYLAPCVVAEDITAIYITGVLTLYRDNSPFSVQREREAIALLKKASDANYKPAILKFAVLYLTGEFKKLGNDADLKATSLFRKMLDLNYEIDIANYCLGYMNMKGLTHPNRIGQYYTARRFFENSNLPMAKHWLAVMDYNGYGIINNEPNKAKALQSLLDNNILNSKSLRASLIAQENNWIPISQEEDKLLREGIGFTSLDKNKLNKTFDGKLIEYDWGWRKNEVRRYQSFTIKFTPNSSTTIPYELKINDQTYTGTGRIARNTMTLSLSIPLKVIYPDHPEISEVKYIFKRLAFRETTLGGDQVWIIKPERGFAFASQENWRERIHNVRFILKDQNITASTTRLSATIKDTADFVVISPNPINDQFTITYNFDKPTDIKVDIYDLYGNKKIDLPIQKSSSIDRKTLPVDSSNLPKGIYLVQMTVNGATYTKTISKN